MDQSELIESIYNLGVNEQLNVSITTTEKKPPYIAIGNGRYNSLFPEDVAMDTLQVFGSLSPTQQRLVLLLRNEMIDNRIASPKNVQLPNPNEVHLSHCSSNEVAVEIKKLLRDNANGKTLTDKKVLVKLKTNVYMFSPYVFVPPYRFNETVQIWDNAIQV
jgi:hypothetical protein